MAFALPPVPRDGPLLLACSGGLDSTVLLHRLAAEPALRARGLRAVHVDHGLHPRSADWAEACAEHCRQLGVALQVQRVTVIETGQGLEALRQTLLRAAGWQAAPEGVFIARERHLRALREVDDHLLQASAQIDARVPALDLLAEELRLAQNALNTITGEFGADDLLGVIFSQFCIGK